MGGACNMYGGEEREFWWGNLS